MIKQPSLFISNIGTLILPRHAGKGVPTDPIATEHDTWLLVKDGKVSQPGAEGQPEPPQLSSNTSIIDAEGRLVTPGLIDSHTHPVFAGTRQSEFVRRCRGETYQQIAAAGGGILSSIKDVRNADESELEAVVLSRLDRFLELGVTTIEAKSGYGLTLEDELKSLRVLKSVSDKHPVDVSATLLGAHVVPPEFKRNPDDYVNLVCERMIPQAAESGLAESIDLFLEEGAFNLDQARRIFMAGNAAGMKLRIHADQFTASGGALLAAEFGALTADHMDQTDDDGLKALAEAGVTVVLLPGAVFFLGLEKYASGRRFIDAGCRIALSTDFNPGSSPTQSLPLMMTLACTKMGLTSSEALWASTLGGAFAVGREDSIGSLQPGYQADICIWDAEDVNYIPYAYGNMIPWMVIKHGNAVARRGCRIDDA